MAKLSDQAKKFMAKNPVLIQTLQGYKFFECPINGEDVPLKCVTPCGYLYGTPFYDLLDSDDLEWLINDYRETKKTFKS